MIRKFNASFLLLPLLLALLYATNAVAQPNHGFQAMEAVDASLSFTETIQLPVGVDPSEDELLSKGGFFTVGIEVDNASNEFVAYVRNDGGSAQGKLFRRSSTGVVTGRWDVRIGTINGIQHKADSIDAVISGDDVVLTLSSHATNEGARIMAIWDAKVEDIAVPYPQGVRATGKAGAFVSSGQSGGGPSLAEIGALIDQKNQVLLTNIRAEFGGNIRQGIEDKTKDAVRELGLWSPSLEARGIDAWSRDRTFEVLRDNTFPNLITPRR